MVNIRSDDEVQPKDIWGSLQSSDKEVIKQMKKSPRLYDDLAKSLAPGVYGHEDVKREIMPSHTHAVPRYWLTAPQVVSECLVSPEAMLTTEVLLVRSHHSLEHTTLDSWHVLSRPSVPRIQAAVNTFSSTRQGAMIFRDSGSSVDPTL